MGDGFDSLDSGNAVRIPFVFLIHQLLDGNTDIICKNVYKEVIIFLLKFKNFMVFIKP
jgi:hypothetical protein